MEKQPRRRQSRGAGFVGAMVLAMACGGIGLRVLLARQSGLGPFAAVHDALVGEGWQSWVVMTVVAFLMGLLVSRIYRPIDQEGTAPEEARAIGEHRWRRLRLFMTICFVICFVASVALSISGDFPDDHDWIAFASMFGLALVLVGYWLWRPTPDRLYVLATGDRSRVDDERAREVAGRSAFTTIRIFLVAILLGGVSYEVVVKGVWPVRSFVEFGVLLALWSLSECYWNRKL